MIHSKGCSFRMKILPKAATLPSASERQIVADQILKNPGGLTPAEREKLVAPLRQTAPATPDPYNGTSN